MGRKEVLAKRKALEEYYYNCKLETPEEVAKLFEVYTKLIWNFHQAGLVYDYYCDHTTLYQESGEIMVGGVDVTEGHTIPTFSTWRNKETIFHEIFCTGNKEDGYRFGQVTTHNGEFAEDGFCSAGTGDGKTFKEGDSWGFCQCVVNKVNGRWVVVDEYLCYGSEAMRLRTAGARPFRTSLLGEVPTTAPQEPQVSKPELEVEFLEMEEEVQK